MLPADTPKLPKWPFLLADGTLLGLAWLIADQSRTPFAGTPLIAIVACVICGAIIGAVPFLADYARRQDEALDERQGSLESLSRTITASAEQIGIAANGMNEIAQVAQRNLKAAEQLPAKLQEKISSLKASPDATRDPEREELKKEIARLRASEGERLQAAADKIARAATELSKLAASRPEPVERSRPERSSVEPSRTSEPASSEPAAAAPANPAEPASAPVADPVSAIVPEAPPAPKRTRKPRPEAAPVAAAPAEAPLLPAETPAPTPSVEPPSASDNPHPAIPLPQSEEPPPVPASSIPEVVPVAPDSNPPIEPAPVATNVAPAAEAPPPKPERKRSPKKPKPDAASTGTILAEDGNPPSEIQILKSSEPTLGLVETPANPDPVEPAAPESVEKAVSSDGATRLLVTAYIGIGNRLFIRGMGPGLSWDKGLPLQFVSIGKWRWETNDATAPVQFKLYKNDDSECTALGAQTLDPGQQQEVTATF